MRTRYWLGVAVAATLLAGCAPPSADPPRVPPPPETRHATLAGGFVTVDLTLPPGRPGPLPVVISPVLDRDTLLAAGFALVDYRAHWEQLKGLRPTPEPKPTPGRSFGKWLLASPSAATVGRGYFGLIGYDARTAIPLVIDHLETVGAIDATRIGITGNSTGGFTALQAVARDDRIAVAAVANACGDYHTFLARSTLGLAGAEPLALAPDYDAWLRAREPIEHPARFPPAAVLLVNGDRDPAIPIACARATARALRGAYARAGMRERFRAVVLPGHVHQLGPDDRAEMLDWLLRWLAP